MLSGVKNKKKTFMHPARSELKPPQNREEYSAHPFIIFCFSVGVFLLPIDWIQGINLFGEYSIMSSFYVFFPLVFCTFPFMVLNTWNNVLATELKFFIILMFLSLFLSLAFNIFDIFESSLKNRSGINKVVTTLITFFFSAGLLIVVANLARDKNFISKAIIKPLLFSFPLVFIVSVIEVIGWYVPAAGNLYVSISTILRSGYQFLESGVEASRMRGVSGEPPSAAIYFAFLLVWCYYLVLKSKHSGQYTISSRLLFGVSCCLLYLTKARTSQVFFLGFIFSKLFISFCCLYKPKKEYNAISLSMPLLLFFIFGSFCLIANSNYIIEHVTNGESVSNLSRYASVHTAINLFYDSPLIGHGPGQYGFKAIEKMPDWGWGSWEVKGWFTDLQRGWPPIFSLPARLAAELGIIGIIAWYLPLFEISRRLLHVLRREHERLQKPPSLGIALFFGMIYVLLQGIAQDSFRFFELWIILGIASTYLSKENPETFYAEVLKTKQTLLKKLSR